MKNLTLEAVTDVCGGIYYGDPALMTTEIKGIVIDSRKLQEGYLFVPVKGERVDGHVFIPAMQEAGAAAVLSEIVLEDSQGPYILVPSTLDALKKIAAFYRRQLTIPVVGITGSVGKTSTKEMIASVLAQKFRVHKTEGNLNNEIGLPLTVFGITEEHEVAVLEMGISDFGEMHRLAEIAMPDVGVITNIGYCHLENLKDRDGVCRAKTEMFEHLNHNAVAVLNKDDDKLAQIREVSGRPVLFYGLLEGDCHASEIENLGFEGIRFRLHMKEKSASVLIPIPGEHNVYNAMAAACVGHALGMEIAEICAGIEAAQTIAGRNHLIHSAGMTIMDDCYNANPVSMKSSIDVLSHSTGRKIAVLGDMGELGEDERALHYEVGAYLASRQIDLLYCAGSLSAEMARAVSDAGTSTEVFHFETKEQLAEALLPELRPQDTILVKASHFMDFTRLVEQIVKGN